MVRGVSPRTGCGVDDEAPQEKHLRPSPRPADRPRASKRLFRQQNEAATQFLKTGKKNQFGDLPPIWPPWEEFGLSALEVSRRFVPLLMPIWEKTGDLVGVRLGLDPNEWSVVNPHTEEAIHQQAFNFCESTNNSTSEQIDTALDKLRQGLVQGVYERGETIPQLTKRVNAIFGDLTKSHARTIAQTETSRADHSAQEIAAKESGVVTGWRWLASSDACEICLAIAARCPTVKLGQPFAVIGDNPTYKDEVSPLPPALQLLGHTNTCE